MIAAANGNEALAHWLLRHADADAGVRDEGGQTAATVARANGHHALAAWLDGLDALHVTSPPPAHVTSASASASVNPLAAATGKALPALPVGGGGGGVGREEEEWEVGGEQSPRRRGARALAEIASSQLETDPTCPDPPLSSRPAMRCEWGGERGWGSTPEPLPLTPQHGPHCDSSRPSSPDSHPLLVPRRLGSGARRGVPALACGAGTGSGPGSCNLNLNLNGRDPGPGSPSRACQSASPAGSASFKLLSSLGSALARSAHVTQPDSPRASGPLEPEADGKGEGDGKGKKGGWVRWRLWQGRAQVTPAPASRCILHTAAPLHCTFALLAMLHVPLLHCACSPPLHCTCPRYIAHARETPSRWR